MPNLKELGAKLAAGEALTMAEIETLRQALGGDGPVCVAKAPAAPMSAAELAEFNSKVPVVFEVLDNYRSLAKERNAHIDTLNALISKQKEVIAAYRAIAILTGGATC